MTILKQILKELDHLNGLNFMVNVRSLSESGITIEELLYLYFVYSGNRQEYIRYTNATRPFYRATIEELESKGYLKRISEGWMYGAFETTEKFEEDILKKGSFEDWLNRWFDLWPKGVKSGGYYVRTDYTGSLKKMRRFIINRPDISLDEILQATKNYIENCRINDYRYMKLAPHFIEKDGISILAGEVEALRDSQSINNEDIEEYGSKEF
jgi:hypothetical protein